MDGVNILYINKFNKFNTKKYKEYNGKIHRVQSVVAEEIKAEIEALPTNELKPGMSPFFQKI